MLRIALAQINTTVGDLPGNQKKILGYIRQATQSQADLVVFPEMTLTGYPPEDLLLKEYFVQDNLQILHSLAKQVKGICAVVGFVDMDRKKCLYNAAALIHDGRLRGVYHKRDLPNYGVFDEKRYFTPDSRSLLWSMKGRVIGLNICEDMWVEHGIYRQQARAGAQILLNISASPFDLGKYERRERLFTQRAKQVKSFVCYTNLVGGQDELIFDGGSLIINPQGKIIANGLQFEEDLLVADLPVTASRKKSKAWISLGDTLKDERPPLAAAPRPRLSQIERMFKALVLGTRDYVKKNGFQKVVIGLSGGVDSALVAVLAREALGTENVIGVTMPSRFSSTGTQTDAKKVAENLGIRFLEIPIEGISKGYAESLKEAFIGRPPDVAEENIQARIRGNLLMALSNKFGWLVLTTGNKSEIAVGYCTLYGDMSGGFAVIKDVPKTKVYELAHFINREREVIPSSIILRAPTAELRENQKDQDSLPPYDVLDRLLQAYVEEHRSFEQMVKIEHDKELVKKVICLVDRSEYKRRQAPPGVKITRRAFGKDWRLPITNRYKGC